MANKQAIITRVKPEVKTELVRLAKSDRRSLSEFLAIALEQLIEGK